MPASPPWPPADRPNGQVPSTHQLGQPSRSIRSDRGVLRAGPVRSRDTLRLSLVAVVGLAMVLSAVVSQQTQPRRQVVSTRTPAYRIDINQADRDTLCLLPGIASRKALRVIESRERQGPFRTPQDLQRVSGIGPKTMRLLEPWITTTSPEGDPSLKAGVPR